MRYNVTKVKEIGTGFDYDIATEDISSIIVDSTENVIEIRGENTRDVKLIPYKGQINMILIDKPTLKSKRTRSE